LKPGTVVNLKTKYHINRFFALIVLSALVLSSLACSLGSLSPTSQTTIPFIPPSSGTLIPTDTSLSTEPVAQVTDTPPALPSPTFTSTPELAQESPTLTTTLDSTANPPIMYYTQSGDTLPSVAVRFNVAASDITSAETPPPTGLLAPGILLIIPGRLSETADSTKILPDSEVVNSPSSLDLDIETFVQDSGGYLSQYREYLSTGWHNGALVVQRVALENSISPRLLLSLLEYRSHWVTGQPTNLAEQDYPLGYVNLDYKGLYKQLSWAVQQLSIGYYGWRAGLLTELNFPDSTHLRIAPSLNAGSVAVQYLFSKWYNPRQWAGALYDPDSLQAVHESLFGNPWLRSQEVEPLYPPDLTQPLLTLPFEIGKTWSLTGGPHSAWGPDGALASLDFAPAGDQHGCVSSSEWVTSSSSGLVIRSENGQVLVDLDGDGYEQTGWVILYLHIATQDRIKVGTVVSVNDRLGHPSCEGGMATGTHVHVARKYNGEWILADGPLPFELDGWKAHAGDKIYLGSLTKGVQTVTASPYGDFSSRITRYADGP
jgi:LasA protease